MTFDEGIHVWEDSFWRNPKSLRWRILSSVLVSALGFFVYLSFNLISSENQSTLLKEIRDIRYPVQTQLQEASFALKFVQVRLEDAAITGEPAQIAEADLFAKQFSSALKKIGMIDSNKRKTTEAIFEAFNGYYRIGAKLSEELSHDEITFEEGLKNGVVVNKAFQGVTKQLDDFKLLELKVFTDSINEVTERAALALKVGFVVGVVMIISLAIIAILTVRGILARINHMAGAMRNIAQEGGDMNVRIPIVERDEMAELAFWFNSFIAKLKDVTEASTREVERMAYTDTLTGLPNRRMFTQHLQTELKRCERLPELSLAVMFLDLDNFKPVNDTLGHDAGDELLIEISQRLLQTLRVTDITARSGEAGQLLARMGGDEFMLILSLTGRVDDAAIVAERILKSVMKPVLINGQSVHVGVSIGIAVYPKDGSCEEELIISADAAMYQAKNNGKSSYAFYDPELELCD